MELKALKDIPSSFLLAKRALIVCVIVSLVSTVGSLCWAFMIGQSFKNSAYILNEDGSAAFAKGITNEKVDAYRKPEIINHAKTFHDLFWNIDQFNLERKIDKALYMIGESGRQMYLTLKAQGHYAKIEAQNLNQSVKIDSIHVNDKVNPYQIALYAKLLVQRTDQKSETLNDFKATFTMYNVARTENNPHGLLIENYRVNAHGIEEE